MSPPPTMLPPDFELSDDEPTEEDDELGPTRTPRGLDVRLLAIAVAGGAVAAMLVGAGLFAALMLL